MAGEGKRRLLGLEELALASRSNDAVSEERSNDDRTRDLGIDPEAANRVAQQRALFVYGIATGQFEGRRDPSGPPTQVVIYDPELVALLEAAWMDGLATGAAATRTAAAEPPQ